jgi:hypothetical protein
MPGRTGSLTPVLDECVQLCLRRLQRDALLQTPNALEDVEAAVLTNSGREPEGQPDRGVIVHDIDAGWHDANDFVRTTLHLHGLSNDCLFVKNGLPQLGREDRERRCQTSGTIRFFLAEEAPLRRLNAKRVEQVSVDRGRPYSQRLIARH